MTDPNVISCPAELWTLIASAVQLGQIKILQPKASYQFTYRDNGNPAPLPADIQDTPKQQGLDAIIESDYDIDVYVYCARGIDGKVTVYL